MRLLPLLFFLLFVPGLPALAVESPVDMPKPDCLQTEECRLVPYKDCCGVETAVCVSTKYPVERFIKGMQRLCAIAKTDCTILSQRPASCKCVRHKCVAVRPTTK